MLIEEVTRRLRNCTPEMDWTSKGKFLTEYAKEMKNSGHDERFRTEIMERAVGKYKKMLDEHERGVKCMYRTREERQTEIEKRGGKAGKDSWFRKKNDNQREKRTSVLRVPYTGGELKKRSMGPYAVMTNRRVHARMHMKTVEIDFFMR